MTVITTKPVVRLAGVGQSQMAGINDAGGPLDLSRRASKYSSWSDVRWTNRTWYPDLIDLVHHNMGLTLEVTNTASGGSAATATYLNTVNNYLDPANDNVVNNWSPTGGLRAIAQAAMIAAGVTNVEVCLGSQDAVLGRTAAQYAADYGLVLDWLLGLGMKLMLHHCHNSSSAARDTVSAGHDLVLASYVDNATVWEGVNFYTQLPGRQADPGFGLLMTDTNHPTVAGHEWTSRAVFRRYADTGWLIA